jgi:hypothetical protein
MSEGRRMGIDRKLRKIFTSVIPYVMARRKATGGFGATPMLPASIEDTYHALNISNLARRYDAVDGNEFDPSADENLRSYLAACQLTVPAGLRTTFQLVWCCRAAGLKIDKETTEANVIARMQASSFLEDWYYGARILLEALGWESRTIVETPDVTSVMKKKWRTVKEAWMHIYLSSGRRKGLPLPRPELIAWFQACQNGDGGFGFFPGTTSFVENCHASLRALDFLKARPLDQDTAFRFLTGCQTISGGFGRSIVAAPFLDATWHALASFAIIG